MVYLFYWVFFIYLFQFSLFIYHGSWQDLTSRQRCKHLAETPKHTTKLTYMCFIRNDKKEKKEKKNNRITSAVVWETKSSLWSNRPGQFLPCLSGVRARKSIIYKVSISDHLRTGMKFRWFATSGPNIWYQYRHLTTIFLFFFYFLIVDN